MEDDELPIVEESVAPSTIDVCGCFPDLFGVKPDTVALANLRRLLCGCRQKVFVAQEANRALCSIAGITHRHTLSGKVIKIPFSEANEALASNCPANWIMAQFVGIGFDSAYLLNIRKPATKDITIGCAQLG